MTGEPLDLGRLRKLCAMFSSDHDGEIANAARMADRLVRAAGLAWEDVLAPALPRPLRAHRAAPDFVRRARAQAQAYAQARPEDDPGWGFVASDYTHWREMLQHCVRRFDSLSERERNFVLQLRLRRAEPTVRQMAWLMGIYGRVTA